MDLEPKNRAETFYNRILNGLNNISNGVSDDEDNDGLTPINRAEIYWTKMIEKLGEIADNSDQTASMPIHICTAQEYNSTTGIPTIVDPDPNMFYLVPGGSASNLYVEWIYVNNAWEKFGSATIDLSNYATLSALNDKIDEPNAEGTSGQVLTTDGNGGRTWTTPQTNSIDIPLEKGTKESTLRMKGFTDAFGPHENRASNDGSIAVGIDNISEGYISYASGIDTYSGGQASHSEGQGTITYSDGGHAEGINTVANGEGGAHSEGWGTILRAKIATIVNQYTYTLSGVDIKDVFMYSPIRYKNENDPNYTYTAISSVDNQNGTVTIYTDFPVGTDIEIYQSGAMGFVAHSEGNCTLASGDSTHAEGNNTVAAGFCQHVEGSFNEVDNNGTYVHIVGIGNSKSSRKNGFMVDWSGNIIAAGSLTLGYGNNAITLTASELQALKALLN